MAETASDSLAKALAAVERPLRFALRGGPDKLDRVKGLEATVKDGAQRALTAVSEPAAREALEALIRNLPSPLGEPTKRFRQLEVCLGYVEQVQRTLEGGAPTGDPASKPQPQVQPKAERAPAAPPKKSTPSSEQPKEPPKAIVPTAARIPDLSDSVQYLKGVGPRVAQHLATRGIQTVDDLLRFLPRRYEDRRGKRQIRDLQPGDRATVEGEVIAKSERRAGRRMMLEVVLGDSSGNLQLTWFRVPGRSFKDRFVKGRRVRVSGTVKIYRGRRQMTHPETQLVEDVPTEAQPEDAVIPVYLEVEGLRPAQVRKVVTQALPAARHLEDALPSALRERHGLAELPESVVALHTPPAAVAVEDLHRMATPWHGRFIYEELLLLQLAVLQRKAQAQEVKGHATELSATLNETATELFDFTLTGAQSRVLKEIEADLGRSVPMQRLLQGDVGSGKTAVALSAAAAVAKAGFQVAIMAPTELLAEQHARVALKTLTAAGLRVGLLTGSLSAAERRRTLAQLRDGHIQVAVGTHALIQDDVRYKKLALCIVDEQHRFGVMQRATLARKGEEGLGVAPDTLVMTATPIPRTLALTVYGDLDVSIIDGLPPGRMPIQTKRYRESQRVKAYTRVRQAVESGRQAYVVFPLVEESDKEGMDRLRDATSAAEDLANGALKGLQVGLLHGRMGADDKDRVMRSFAAGEIQVLVATTVIEVGIDVPNATVMVIENAERFGLSQLHQLRGRVGRGSHQSECILLAQYTQSEDAWARMRVMEESNDGFRIAEEDLKIRGPGDFVGTRQSGIPMLWMADLVRDQGWLQKARMDAQEILDADPSLTKPENQGLRRRVSALWEGGLELVGVG